MGLESEYVKFRGHRRAIYSKKSLGKGVEREMGERKYKHMTYRQKAREHFGTSLLFRYFSSRLLYNIRIYKDKEKL
jgi:hypothetical protein